MIKKLRILLLLSLLTANPLFTKELPDLFEVMISDDQYTNTNDGLNKAFNRLIFKLSGSRERKNLWKLGNINKIDFVSSYSMENIDDQDYLSVKFNIDSFVSLLRTNRIPLIGFNRPVILLLLKIDSGESSPSYISANSSDHFFGSMLSDILQDIADERGVYIELPTFDLEDQNLLDQTDVLFSPQQHIKNKFYNDFFLSVEIMRVGVNQWAINGDIKSSSTLRQKEVLDYLAQETHAFLDQLLFVEPLKEGMAGDKIVISVKGLETYEDFELMNSELNKVFAIKSKDFNFFDRSYIDYNVQLFQTTDSLLKELKGSTRFLIKSFDKNLSKLELEYLN